MSEHLTDVKVTAGEGVDLKLQRQRVEQSLDWALNHGHKFGDAYVLANEVIRLRRTLSGIASCSTCEACRGAARLALGTAETTGDGA